MGVQTEVRRSESGVAVSTGLLRAVLALSLVAALVFAGVALHEINYASNHPFAFGPAHVIAWGAGAGALLAAAVVVFAGGLMQRH